jgi:hypothetical protein
VVSVPNVGRKCPGSQLVEIKSKPGKPDVVMQLYTCSNVAVLGAARWSWLRAHQVRQLAQANCAAFVCCAVIVTAVVSSAEMCRWCEGRVWPAPGWLDR